MQLDAKEMRCRLAAESFERELGIVYRDPLAVRAAFERLAVERGIESAVERMRRYPEQLGTLAVARESRSFGPVTNDSDAAARRASLSAAMRGRDAWEARARLATLVGQREICEAVPKVVQLERTAREALGRVQEKRAFERQIGHVMRQLIPHEIEELRRAVTRPQFAVAMKIRQVAREVVFAWESPEQKSPTRGTHRAA